MRLSSRSVVALVLSLAYSIGAGCSGAGGTGDEAAGGGGETSFSTGEFSDNGVGTGVSVPPGRWVESYGDEEDQHASAVALSPGREIALVGTAKGTIDFGNIPWEGSATDTDVVVAKLTYEGQALWSRRYGDSCDQRGGAVAHAPSGAVVLAGDYCGKMDFGTSTIETKGGEIDLFIAAIDTLGEDIYSRSFGGKGAQIARAAAVDLEGNAILVGSFDQAFDDGSGEAPSAGMDDAFVIKLDPEGTLLWSLRLGGPESDIPRSVAVDLEGNILIGGSFGGSVDFGGGPIAASAGHSSGFLVELDPGGKHLWSKSLGADSEADTAVNGVAVSVKGVIAATGTFAGTADFGSGPVKSAGGDDAFLATMDGAGTPIWGRTVGGPGAQHSTGVAFGAYDFVGMSGRSDEILDLTALNPSIELHISPAQVAPDTVYAVKYSDSGVPTVGWTLKSNTSMESVGFGLDATNEDLGMVLAGSFQHAIAHELDVTGSHGAWDMFIARTH